MYRARRAESLDLRVSLAQCNNHRCPNAAPILCARQPNPPLLAMQDLGHRSFPSGPEWGCLIATDPTAAPCPLLMPKRMQMAATPQAQSLALRIAMSCARWRRNTSSAGEADGVTDSRRDLVDDSPGESLFSIFERNFVSMAYGVSRLFLVSPPVVVDIMPFRPPSPFH